MKRLQMFLLAVFLLFSLYVPAYALDTAPPDVGTEQAESGTEQPENTHAPITTLQELEAAIAAADSEDTIALSNTIVLDGVTLTTDKALTLTTTSDFCNSNLVELNNGAMISGFSFAYDGDCTAVYTRNSSVTAIVRNCSFDCASAIYVAGNMDGEPTAAYIEGCTFTHAQTSAVNVLAFANVEIESCTFTHNAATMQGGAVRNNGTLTIRNSTITDNRAASGGGVFNSGTLTITNTVIHSNMSTNADFGADIFSYGIMTLTDEQTKGAAYYEETTGEKTALPLSACADTVKLVYLTDEEAAERFPPPVIDQPTTETPPTAKPTAPTYTPPNSRPSIRPKPERQETPDTVETAHNTETPVIEKAPPLVCGEAVIDTSRSVVLYGYEDGLLHLEDSLTRGQMATIIYRLLDENTLALYDTAEVAFTDVPAEMWCCRYISTIAKAGVVAGTGNGCYGPNGRLTWAQIITVMSRFVEPVKCTLRNISYNGWAAEAVQTAVALGWIEDSATFNPNAIISRGEFMDFVNGVLALYHAV